MEAAERAKNRPEYKEGGEVGIDSRIAQEMGYLSREDFGSALIELKKKKVLDIRCFANEENEHYERHFRFTPKEPAFKKLYTELEKKNPAIADPATKPQVLKYAGLSFDVQSGNFTYGKVTGNLKPYTQPWSMLYILMKNKENVISKTDIARQIARSWIKGKSKKAKKSQDKIDFASALKGLRKKLKMGKVDGAVNPDLIEGDGHNSGYILKKK
jgi:hypothetical protein